MITKLSYVSRPAITFVECCKKYHEIFMINYQVNDNVEKNINSIADFPMKHKMSKTFNVAVMNRLSFSL